MAERSRFRGLAIGLGVTAATAAAVVAAQRTAVRRLRGRPDPGASEDLTELPPEDLGPVRSFDGTELHVRAAGPKDAPVLLFLHGFSLDMTTWHYQWKAFSDRYRCVLVDHRAHGRSGRPASGDYSLVAMGKDIETVLRLSAGDGPVILVGHSMGGMAILSFVQQFPEEFSRRVAGVVFTDTAASDVLREVFGGLGARLGWALRRAGTRYSDRPELAERLQKRVRKFGADLTFLVGWATNFGPGASPSHVEHVSRISADAPVEVWVHTLRDITEIDLRDVLEHIMVPSLVVVGDRDLITPKTSAQAMRAALPDATAVVITGAGHVSMLERHRVFNEVMERFLAKVFARSRAAAGRA
ncbi:MAG TPA: alpha/beta hydrolase [Actinomycetota bacterium]|nr:alpha/beta hydrolase [Actinomycetota bacterium]